MRAAGYPTLTLLAAIAVVPLVALALRPAPVGAPEELGRPADGVPVKLRRPSDDLRDKEE